MQRVARGFAVAAAVVVFTWLDRRVAGAAQNAPAAGVRVQLLVDDRRAAAARKQIRGQDEFRAFTYRMRPGPPASRLAVDSDELARRWAGSFVLGQTPVDPFESEFQFAPVMLVLDVSNEGGAAAQVVDAYLEADLGMTDLRPFIHLSPFDRERERELFDLMNHGWGRAENAVLTFAFGRDAPTTETFTLALGSLGAVEVLPLRAMAAVSPAVLQLQRQSPRCPSVARVRACLEQLERQAPLGRLSSIAYLRGDRVLTRLFGTLSYQWRDAQNQLQRQQTQINVELLVFKFDTGESAEMGAAAPEERGFRAITLPLDRAPYRLPLPYRARIDAGMNRRFELTLTAPKSSRHRFRVVLQMADGSRAASPPVDLSFFKPLTDVGELRTVR